MWTEVTASMYLGYNTNGFAHHRLEDALCILAELGYGGVALTLDFHVLDPFAEDLGRQCEGVRHLLKTHRLRSVIETGARFLLDPRRKHQPTLVSPTPEERARRLDFLMRAVDLAADLGSEAVSFWSGTPLDAPAEEVWMARLVEGCLRLCDHAARRGVRLAFEPEPGMAVDTMARFERIHARVKHPQFGLTLDVGHLHCQDEGSPAEVIEAWQSCLWNVHIEDMRRGVHDHLFFGEGEMDFAPILAAFTKVGYSGGLYVELSRHSHNAVETARRSLHFLNRHWKG